MTGPEGLTVVTDTDYFVSYANGKYISKPNTPDVQPGLLFIKMVGGEPRIGVDVAVDSLNLVAKINLDDAEWVSIDCVKADDDADEYLWFKPTLNDTNGNAYRFFKLAE